MTLTDRQIRSAQVPAGLNQIELRDDQVRGLLLRVYRSGARTWMLHYRRHEDDRRRFLKLGLLPAAATNVWTVAVHPGRTFTYTLCRDAEGRRLRVELDLTRLVEVPQP